MPPDVLELHAKGQPDKPALIDDRPGRPVTQLSFREFNQRVNQLGHALRGRANAVQVSLAFGVKLVGIIIEQGLAEAVNRPQRRPQVVGGRIREGFQLLIGCFELRGALAQLLNQASLAA